MRGRARRRRGTILVRRIALLVAAVVLGTGFLLREPGPGPDLLEQVIRSVRTHALDVEPTAELHEAAARGLLREIGDPYAALFSPAQVAEFARESIGDSYGGLGMEVGQDDSVTVVTRVFPGGPAQAGGLRPGDRILAVDGQRVVGLPVERVTERLLGRIGTPLEVTLLRPPGDRPFSQRFVRAAVHQPSVPFATMLDDSIGYVPLRMFNATATAELAGAIERLRAAGARRFLLDLRGNSGGHLREAVDVAGLFLPAGAPVVDVRSRAEADRVLHSDRAPLEPAAPLVVLVDEGSASASEIVAGALQDHDRALLVGVVTFGKGLVQDLIRLDGGWMLKLTTARWYTPSGRSIQRALSNDSTRAVSREERPLHRTRAGRSVLGGGGIFPDSVVEGKAVPAAEAALLRDLAERSARLGDALLGAALESAAAELPRDFVVSPAERMAVLRRLEQDGVAVDSAAWADGAGIVDRWLEQRILSLEHGELEAFRRRVPHDAQLLQAIRLLNAAESTAELLGGAQLQPTGGE